MELGTSGISGIYIENIQQAVSVVQFIIISTWRVETLLFFLFFYVKLFFKNVANMPQLKVNN